MQTASSLSIPSNATPPNYYSLLGRGLHAIWVDNGTTIGTPTSYGTLIMAIFTAGDAMQIFVASGGSMYVRSSTSSTQTWKNWLQVTLA